MIRPAPKLTLCLASSILLSNLVAGQSTARMSVNSTGTEANGPSSASSCSEDGLRVAFASTANNLVTGDTNGAGDVFIRDRQTSTTILVSVDSMGVQGNQASTTPMVSGDGRYIVFASSATNLVANDTNAVVDIFRHDLVSGGTVRVSTSAAGAQANSTSSTPSISRDGRFVAFTSAASNLVIGDSNGLPDVFVRDLATGTVTRASVDASGGDANGPSSLPFITSNGGFVGFVSTATNLVIGDTNGIADAFIYDRLLASNVRVNVSTAGAQAATWPADQCRVSDDGRWATFASGAGNLTGEGGGLNRVFLRDTFMGVTTRISQTYLGAPVTSHCYSPTVSGDGGFVAYTTDASDVIHGDTNNAPDVFVYERSSGATIRASAGSGGLQGNSQSRIPFISSNGLRLTFESSASNLVPNDANGQYDVFFTDLAEVPYLFCFGDGSATACPCSNVSPVGANAGCLNSTGNGARLYADGVISIAADSVVLHGVGMTNGPCLYFQGTTAYNYAMGVALGDGLRCAGGTIVRLGLQVNVGGASQYPGAGDSPISVKGACLPGDTRSYQVWYRDAQLFCAPETYNLSNGVAFPWKP